MSNLVQYIIVGVVVATAVTLAIRSIYRLITHKKSALNPCDSCKLKDACNKKNEQSLKKRCDFDLSDPHPHHRD